MFSILPCGAYFTALWFSSRSCLLALFTAGRRQTHHQSVNVFLARSDIHGSQSLLQVQCLSNVFCASDNPQSEETGRATGTESVHADSLADWDTLGTTVGEDGSKSTVQRSGVHVSASLYAVG